eukprot:6213491-Pleurochrysis_carterae.AAC.1
MKSVHDEAGDEIARDSKGDAAAAVPRHAPDARPSPKGADRISALSAKAPETAARSMQRIHRYLAWSFGSAIYKYTKYS